METDVPYYNQRKCRFLNDFLNDFQMFGEIGKCFRSRNVVHGIKCVRVLVPFPSYVL